MTYKKILIVSILMFLISGLFISLAHKNSDTKIYNRINNVNMQSEAQKQDSLDSAKDLKQEDSKISKINDLMIIIVGIFCTIFFLIFINFRKKDREKFYK